MKRVVITGMGIVSSIGNNAQEVTASLRESMPLNMQRTCLPSLAFSISSILVLADSESPKNIGLSDI